MNFKRVLLSFILIFSIFLISNQEKSYAIFGIENKTKAALIADADSGAMFVMENIDEQLSIASISKLMTYYVVRDAIESGKISMDTEITVPISAAGEQGSSLNLKVGEKILVKDLIDGLMVVSGNDAAKLLAETVAGTETEFVSLMNQKAQEIGLTNSNFVNSSGLPMLNGEDNKMSSKDIFLMAQSLIKTYPEVLDYAKIQVLEQPNRNFKKESTIPLVGQVEGVDGLKTGYTEEAGYCLVSTMKITKGESDFRVIAVLMGAKTKQERAQYMKDMLTYVRENIETKKLVDSQTFVKKINFNKSDTGYVELVPDRDVERVSLKNIAYEISTEIDNIKLPLKQGDVVGKLNIKNSETVVDTVNLVAKQDYKKTGFIKRIGRLFLEIYRTIETILP